ncbi:MAG: hypothetical protein M1814_005766 [Vezdaea aestivalis]|nr:MAG: hypothetical protein M1814_005766 [Vezdaea aestivalis]
MASSPDVHIPFLKEIHSPGRAPDVDIVFVHGLNVADNPHLAWETWTEDGVFWPKDFLTEDIPEARIFLYGYNSNVNSEVSEARIKDHAGMCIAIQHDESDNLDTLLYKLRHKRRIKRKTIRTPIIFVGHSLGGLVIKTAMLNAKDNSKYQAIADDTKGLVFFGCPHKGTNELAFGNVIARIAEYITLGQIENGLGESLKRNSRFTIETNERFSQQLDLYQIISFVESQPMYFGGAGSDARSGIVVERAFATLGLPSKRETCISINRDHVSMCRVTGREMYEDIKSAFIELVEEILPNIDQERDLSGDDRPSNSRSESELVTNGSPSEVNPTLLNLAVRPTGGVADTAHKPSSTQDFSVRSQATVDLDPPASQIEAVLIKSPSRPKTPENNISQSMRSSSLLSPRKELTLCWPNDKAKMSGLAALRSAGHTKSVDGVFSPDELAWAIRSGNVQALRYLLVETKADLTAKYNEGWSALHLAASAGYELNIRILLEAGADLAAEDDDGNQPLSIASRYGHGLIVRILLDAGSAVNHKSMPNAWTALIAAASYGNEPTIRVLLDAGADIEVKTTGIGSTALHWAVKRGNESILRVLLDAGADIEATTKDGSTALHWAACIGNESAIRVLLDAGADIEVKTTSNGSTALHWAALKGNESTVRVLLDAGADVTVKNRWGQTAAKRAKLEGYTAVAKFLEARSPKQSKRWWRKA